MLLFDGLYTMKKTINLLLLFFLTPFLISCSFAQNNTEEELAKTVTSLLAKNNQTGFNKIIMTREEWIKFADKVVTSSKKSSSDERTQSDMRILKEFIRLRNVLTKEGSDERKRLTINIERTKKSFDKVRLSATKAGIDWKNYKIVSIKKQTNIKFNIKNSDIRIQLQSSGATYRFEIDDAYNWNGEWKIGDLMRN